MLAFLQRSQLEMEDWLRHNAFVRRLVSHVIASAARFRVAGATRRIAMLCAAARLAGDNTVERRIQDELRRELERFDAASVDWPSVVPDFHDRHIGKGAIIKPSLPSGEKGVVFISFEKQWVKLLALPRLREFSERYTVVLAPSSSPHNFINYVFPLLYPDPAFTLISNAHDLEVLPRVSSRLMTVPLYASQWINPDLYRPLPSERRTYDLIMVASWGKVKRHQALFAALRSMPGDLRMLLVGQDQDGRTGDSILELARCYGVADRFTLLSNQSSAEVTRLFCQSRASVVLSKREGSCVVVAESLFADTPVALLQGAVMGSRGFVNGQTGVLLDEQHLARDLAAFVWNSGAYRPREWATQNIDCYRSTRRLNAILKEHARSCGRPWTRDIWPLQWSPDPILASPRDFEDADAERQRIVDLFGLEIGLPVPLADRSKSTEPSS